MEKRGLSNVEMVLAFVLFIGSVLFVLYFFITQFSQNDKNDSINYNYNKIAEKLYGEIESYSVKINRNSLPVNQEIVSLNIIKIINLGKNVAVYNLSNYKVPIYLVNNFIYVNVSGIGDLIIVRLSEDINMNYTSFSSLPLNNEGYYQIASVKKDKIFSEKKLRNINISYYNDYNKLKEDLGISSGSNFGWIIIYFKICLT